MVHRKSIRRPVAASGGLLVVLLAVACGSPEAAPGPVTVPTITTTTPTSASVPANATISVRPTTTTLPPTVDATTEPPPPPPVQAQPQPRPTTVKPTHPGMPEDWENIAIRGFPCEQEGATAADPTGRELVCTKSRRGKLLWN